MGCERHVKSKKSELFYVYDIIGFFAYEEKQYKRHIQNVERKKSM